MKIFVRTVMSSWMTGMSISTARSVNMIHARRGDSSVYVGDGRQPQSNPIRPQAPILKVLHASMLHQTTVAGSEAPRSRPGHHLLPGRNPLTCHSSETICPTHETSWL